MSLRVHVLRNVPMLQLMEQHIRYSPNHYTQVMLIMEYLSRGDLLNHLMNCRYVERCAHLAGTPYAKL